MESTELAGWQVKTTIVYSAGNKPDGAWNMAESTKDQARLPEEQLGKHGTCGRQREHSNHRIQAKKPRIKERERESEGHTS